MPARSERQYNKSAIELTYDIQFKPRAIKDLADLPARVQTRILAKIEALRVDLRGDVKRLTNFSLEYRLRVGKYRVLFEIEGEEVLIYRVRRRSEAYR